MRVIFEAVRWRLVVDLSPAFEEEVEEVEEAASDRDLGGLDAQLAFGFSPDPVFPEFYYEEEESNVDIDTAN